MAGDPPELPPGIPPGASFCGNMRWHRNEMRPSNAIINAAFPDNLIESAKTKDVSLTIMSIPVGTERMIQFDGIRLGQTSGKWRISGATALVNSINMSPDSKHVAWYRKTIDGEVHWFVTGPIGDPVEGNLCLPSARISGEPGDGSRSRRKRSSKERGAQADSSDDGGDEDGGGAGRGRSAGRGKRPRMGLHSTAEMHSALIANGADATAANAALAAAAAAVSGTAMGLGLGIPHEVAAAAAAAAAAGGQAACKVVLTPRMRQGGFVVLDHVFGAVAGLTVTGAASSASLMLSLAEPEGTVVNAVLALSVVPASEDMSVEPALASAVVLGALGPWMQARAVAAGDTVMVARTLPGNYYIAVEHAHPHAAPAGPPGEEGGGAEPGSSSGREAGGSGGGSAPGTSPHPPDADEGHGAGPGAAGHHEHGDAGGGSAAAAGEAEAGSGRDEDMAPADEPADVAPAGRPQSDAEAEAEAGTSKAVETDGGAETQAALGDGATADQDGATGAPAAKEPASEALATTAAAPADAMDVDRPAASEAPQQQQPQQQPQQEPEPEPSARPEPRTTRGRASAAAATAAAVKASGRAPEGPSLRTRRKTEPPPAPAAGKGKGEARVAAAGTGKDKAARAESAEAPAPAAADAAAVGAQEPTWQDLFLRTANEAVGAWEGREPLPKPRHDTAEVVGRLLAAGREEDFSCVASATHLVLVQLLAAEQRAAQAAAGS
ncbi:hypothetical protein HXX76_008004 [Chlamydomonas incerta]|uniref:Uncharacterized protein n=1 Tax=Chlamydomonas incerta TaxID=51695 RepID=A0A835T8B6_CHLIN|nr:hypothetical protein HXX76_008004 [Chlamydomonas incerta]|eukprot:KAG2434280.1 hypothetical protein HXX76_008004 [Chlamydomonas incerta]